MKLLILVALVGFMFVNLIKANTNEDVVAEAVIESVIHVANVDADGSSRTEVEAEMENQRLQEEVNEDFVEISDAVDENAKTTEEELRDQLTKSETNKVGLDRIDLLFEDLINMIPNIPIADLRSFQRKVDKVVFKLSDLSRQIDYVMGAVEAHW